MIPAKPISVLGATGSIGASTLDIVREFPERFRVVSLSCHQAVEQLAAQIREFQPNRICVGSETAAGDLRASFPEVEVCVGETGLVQLASDPEVELVVSGIVGAAGLLPGYAAVQAGKVIAIANKEPLVLAGELFVNEAQRTGATLLPADSEHNAIFQALHGHSRDHVARIILTASGGPFRDRPLAEFANITVDEALAHPNWKMGPKVTIDSATMMNKGLEVFEAHWLFGLPVDQIRVVIHRQSIVHSLAEFVDGSFLAQLGLPDMRIPIAYCLAYPDRLPLSLPELKLEALGRLDFAPADLQRFPCLRLAMQTTRWGGNAPAVMNGANEMLVAAFLAGEIRFLDIAKTLEAVLQFWKTQQAHPELSTTPQTLDDALCADAWGRKQASTLMNQNLTREPLPQAVA